MQEELKNIMNKNFLEFKNLSKVLTFITMLIIHSGNLFAQEKANFRQVEAVGRSILLPNNLETSRKRALEDALYIAALKGGADVNGFSAINSNTVINEQSVIKATNRVIDFKILSENQDKEFLRIKISAVVGDETAKINCTSRPLNITLLKGFFSFDTNVPSKLGRYTPIWYKQISEIVSNTPNVKITDHKNKSLEQIIKSSINPSFDYNAITNGLPEIQSGDFSIVPKLFLTKISEKNSYLRYLLRVTFDIYKGQELKLLNSKSYDLKIKFQYGSKFQFVSNIFTSNIDSIDKMVRVHLFKATNNFLNEINCRPLEGKLTLNDGILMVDLGRKQGIKQKQIGLVKGINIKNSMINNSSIIVHTDNIFDNYSTVLPLNDNVKLTTMNNMIVKFVE